MPALLILLMLFASTVAVDAAERNIFVELFSHTS